MSLDSVEVEARWSGPTEGTWVQVTLNYGEVVFSDRRLLSPGDSISIVEIPEGATRVIVSLEATLNFRRICVELRPDDRPPRQTRFPAFSPNSSHSFKLEVPR